MGQALLAPNMGSTTCGGVRPVATTARGVMRTPILMVAQGHNALC